jgi:hypothetical protein
VLLIIARACIVEPHDPLNTVIGIFVGFVVPLLISWTEWMALNVPICQDNGRADDSTEVLQASPVSTHADSK